MISIKVEGQQVGQTLTDWINDLESKLSTGVTNVALAIEAKAKQNVSTVRTGNLRRSIQTQTEGLTACVSSNQHYAPYIEAGTGIYADNGAGRQQVPWVYYDLASGSFYTTYGIQPTHFLSNAITAVEPQIEQIIQQAVMTK